MAHENVPFSNGNNETGNSKIADQRKLQNAELHLKGTIFHKWSAARLPELASEVGLL